MDAWQVESGLGVDEGEDPDNFDFDENRWTWTPSSPSTSTAAAAAAAATAAAAAVRRPSCPASFRARTGAPARSPGIGTASLPAGPLSISTPWLWLSTSGGGGGGGPADGIDMDSISSRLSSFFSGGGGQQQTQAAAAAAGGMDGGSILRGGGDDGSAPAVAGGALGGMYGGGEELGGVPGGRVAMFQEEDLAVAELKNLARALQASAPWSISVQRPDVAGGWTRSRSSSRGVQLDLSAAQALQSALQRGGFMPRGKTGLLVDAAAAAVTGEASKVVGGCTGLDDGGSGDVGGKPGGGRDGGGSSQGPWATGGAARAMVEGGGDYAYSQEGGVMAYYDDGTDGRRRRLLLPPPPVGREETALVCKLFRLSRDLTALRVHRGVVEDAPVPRLPLALEMFPALQELRLEGIPLEFVEGLPTLRMQLKLLSFEGAPLSSLVALLAIYAGVLPGSSAAALSRRGSASALAGGGGGGGGGGGDGEARGGAKREDEDTKGAIDGEGKGGGENVQGMGAENDGDSTQAASPEEASDGGHEENSSGPGVSGGEASAGGGKRLAEEPELGLEGLQSRLGMGTPMLHWSLLETLSVCRCGLLELDPSLRLLPAVRRLSLAHNQIFRVDFLQDCASLEELDLSYNRLESLENVHAVVGNLRSLKLRGNLIARTAGLDRMFSLQDVDLSDNRIHGLEEAGRLSKLPLLRRVWLEGNPLEEQEGKAYRVTVLSLLYQGRGAELDRVARIVNKSSMGMSVGIGTGTGDEEAADGGGSVGVALDGRLPSRKEIGRLSRLCFTKAAEVPLARFSSSSLASNGGAAGTDGAHQGESGDGGSLTAALPSGSAAAPESAPSPAAPSPPQRGGSLPPQRRRALSRKSSGGIAGTAGAETSGRRRRGTRVVVIEEAAVAGVADGSGERGDEGAGAEGAGDGRVDVDVDVDVEAGSGMKECCTSSSQLSVPVAVAVAAATPSSSSSSGLAPAKSGGDAEPPEKRPKEVEENSPEDDASAAAGKDGDDGPPPPSAQADSFAAADDAVRYNSAASFADAARAAAAAGDSATAVQLLAPLLLQMQGGGRLAAAAAAAAATVAPAEVADTNSPTVVDDGDGGGSLANILRERRGEAASEGRQKEGEEASAEPEEEGGVGSLADVLRKEREEKSPHQKGDEPSPSAGGTPAGPSVVPDVNGSTEYPDDGAAAAAAVAAEEEKEGPRTEVEVPPVNATGAGFRVGVVSPAPGWESPLTRRRRGRGSGSSGGSSEGGLSNPGSMSRSPQSSSGSMSWSLSRSPPLSPTRSWQTPPPPAVAAALLPPRKNAWERRQEETESSAAVGAPSGTPPPPPPRPPLPAATGFPRKSPSRVDKEKAEGEAAAAAAPGGEEHTPAGYGTAAQADPWRASAAAPPPGGLSGLLQDEEEEEHEEFQDCNDGGGEADGDAPAVFEMKNLGENEAAAAASAAAVTDWEFGDDNDEFVWAGGAGKEERGGLPEGGVIGEGGAGYRGDVAYAGLLIAEHLELFFRQQVFNGSAPYLLYEGHPTNLPPAMRRHREASKTTPEKVVAIFRETVLPCLSPSHHHHYHHHHHRNHSGGAVTAAAAVAAALLSGGGGGSFRGSKARRRDGGSVVGVGGGGVVGVGSSEKKTLAATGMIQQVHRRAVNGEARGVTMGEVACVVVATETSVFFIDGGFAKKSTLFWEAPWPRVLLVLPLAGFERTTIGFRLQKLEVHFDLSACGGGGGGGGDGGDDSSTGSFAAVAANEEVGGGGEPEERISVVLLTRDRSRTFNLLQTLEPLATKARRKVGLPPTAVENRDEATLEAITHALPPCVGTGARVPGGRTITDTPAAPLSPPRQALTARPSTTSSWSPVGSSTSASSPTKAGPDDDQDGPPVVPVAVRPSTTEIAGADTAAAIAAAAEQPLDMPGGEGGPGVFRRVGKWAGKLVSKNKRRDADGDGDDDGDGVEDGGVESREERTGRRRREGDGRQEEERGFETAEGGDNTARLSGTGGADNNDEILSTRAARSSSTRVAAGGPGSTTPAGEGEDFSLVFPIAAPSSLATGGVSGAGDEDSRFLPAPDDARNDNTSEATAPGYDGGGNGGGGGGRGVGGVDCFGNGGAVVVFQLLMQRWRLRPWVVVPRTLVATKEQLALVDEDHSRILNTNDGSSLLGVPWETATAASSPARSPRDASPPRASGGVFSLDRGGWSGDVDPGYFADARQPPSFNENSDFGVFSPGGGRGSGVAGEGGGAGWSGGGEMGCVDSVDLGDVLDVRQEESAPEQVVIEMKGEKAFDKRRHWRLQCRTGANAERVASAVLRLSLERARQRRLASSWWKR